MSDISKKVKKIVGKIVNRFTNTLSQDENRMAGVAAGAREKFTELLTEAGAEGIVLLRNDGTLPLKADETVAYFGRCQFDWFYIGYGSGGDVIAPEKINLDKALAALGVKVYEPLREAYTDWLALPQNEADHGYWGNWPYNFDEMPLAPALVAEAGKAADTAVIVIGRAAGEDRENVLKEGSYYLTQAERDMLDAVTSAFDVCFRAYRCAHELRQHDRHVLDGKIRRQTLRDNVRLAARRKIGRRGRRRSLRRAFAVGKAPDDRCEELRRLSFVGEFRQQGIQ